MPESGNARLGILNAEAFIRRFWQHVLPKGFVKVRSYGFFVLAGRCGASPGLLLMVLFALLVE